MAVSWNNERVEWKNEIAEWWITQGVSWLVSCSDDISTSWKDAKPAVEMIWMEGERHCACVIWNERNVWITVKLNNGIYSGMGWSETSIKVIFSYYVNVEGLGVYAFICVVSTHSESDVRNTLNTEIVGRASDAIHRGMLDTE